MTEEMRTKDATRYVVLALPEMAVMSGPCAVEGDARKRAEALAHEKPGVEFGIYQKVLVSRAELVVETKGIVG
jgi:hypothetical protein